MNKGISLTKAEATNAATILEKASNLIESYEEFELGRGLLGVATSIDDKVMKESTPIVYLDDDHGKEIYDSLYRAVDLLELTDKHQDAVDIGKGICARINQQIV